MKKILIIIPYNIFPPYWGAASRIYNIVKQIAKQNKIFLLYNDYKQIQKHSIDCEEYKELSSNPNVKIFSVKSRGKFSQIFNLKLIKKGLKIIKEENIDFIFIEHVWLGIQGILLSYFSKIPFMLDEHNVEFLKFERMKRGNKISRHLLRWYENITCTKAIRVFCVSDVDKKFLVADLGIKEEKIGIIPNGIDTEKFYPNYTKKDQIRVQLKLSDNPIILFFGKLDYIPNQEAIKIINSEILPRVLKKIPNAIFLIVGDHPPKKIEHENVIFTGVVDKIEDFINACSVVICPLTSGGGTRFKILEALACGKVVISTKIGAEGLKTKGIEESLILCDEWEDFANEIIVSLEKQNLKFNKEYVDNYSWKKNTVLINRILNQNE